MLSCRNSIFAFRVRKNFFDIVKRSSTKNDSKPQFSEKMPTIHKPDVISLHCNIDFSRSFHSSKCILSHANRIFMPVEEFVQPNKDGKPKARNSNISLRFVIKVFSILFILRDFSFINRASQFKFLLSTK